MRSLWLLRLSCLAAAFACTPAAPAADPAPASSTISVMSFNIRFGTAKDGDNAWPLRRDLVVETVAQRDPDLLGLQESVDFQVDYLRERLPAYAVYAVPRTPGPGSESCAVFYRRDRFEKVDAGTFWLSETPDTEASKSWDSSLPRIVSWVRLKETASGRVFVFANTHFDHLGSQARTESARLVRKRLAEVAGGVPAVLTGDFNCGEGSEPHRLLTAADAGWLDTLRQHTPKADPANEITFTGFGLSPGTARIDWVLATAGWDIIDAGIDRFRGKDGRHPSDHEPVFATLRLQPVRP